MQNPIAEFFDLSDFAQEAIYTNPSGVLSTIRVIFDQAFSATTIGRDDYETTSPMVHCKTSDVTDATSTCRVKVGTVNYYVIRKEYDVQGISRLILSLDPP